MPQEDEDVKNCNLPRQYLYTSVRDGNLGRNVFPDRNSRPATITAFVTFLSTFERPMVQSTLLCLLTYCVGLLQIEWMK